MDPLVALVATAAGACLAAVVPALLLVRAQRRRTAARARAYEHRLAQSATEIERLGDRLDALSAEVARAEATSLASTRSSRAEEYVITTLTGLPQRDRVGARVGGRMGARVDLEGQLVSALARQRGGSVLRDRAVDVVVQGVALAHGLRRALRPDTLDRAAAEAQVARRRSRRLRRAEIREARKLVRVLRDVA